MPHYVTLLDDQSEDTFAVYSTIVDNLITETMGAASMKAWLVENDYGAWLTQDPEYGLECYNESTRASIVKYRIESAERMYWHDEGFQYVRYSDYWFTLPRSDWRS